MKNFTENELKKHNTAKKSDNNKENLDKTNDEGNFNENLKNEIEQLKKENLELKDKVEKCLYVIAEKDNIIKKTKNDIVNESQLALQKFIKSNGSAIDDLMRILRKSDDNALKMVFNKFIKSFEDNNIIIKFPEKGDTFDPMIHNAVSCIVDSQSKDNTVADAMSAYYIVCDKVILNAMVVVVKNDED